MQFSYKDLEIMIHVTRDLHLYSAEDCQDYLDDLGNTPEDLDRSLTEYPSVKRALEIYCILSKESDYRKSSIMDAISISVYKLLYADRLNDPKLPLDVIENSIRAGIISREDIIDYFRNQLTIGLKGVKEYE